MQIEVGREELLKPLGHVTAVVERRQTLPILSNVLLRAAGETLELTGTDLEIEVIATLGVRGANDGAVTVPARKLYDICRALPTEAELAIRKDGERLTVQSGRSRFSLATLEPADFPSVDVGTWALELRIPQAVLKRVLERTQFCMAHQDVRYYLNGLLLELAERRLRAVATDGHRMGLSEVELDPGSKEEKQVIVPRKGVLELSRFLGPTDDPVTVQLSSNHIRVSVVGLTLTSKLIDGRFPDYKQVLPNSYRRVVRADRVALREALSRVAILANEKYRGVRMTVRPGSLLLTAHNPEQEEAQEELAVSYDGDEVEVGFNVNYVAEALAGLESDEVQLGINDPNTSCALESPGDNTTRYVVMPMRL